MQGIFVLMLLLVAYQANNRGILHSMIQIIMSYSPIFGVLTPPA